MTSHVKYLVTLDEDTGDIVRVEKLGEAGELTEVTEPPFQTTVSQPVASSTSGGYVVNIFMGESAPPQITTSAAPPPKPPGDVGILPSPGATNPPRPRPKPKPKPDEANREESGNDGGDD